MPARSRYAVPALRATAVAGLAVDVYVHLRLAPLYDQIGSAVTQGALFRVEAALAAAAGLWLLLKDNRAAWLSAGLVALGGAVAVLLTRYVDVPAVGPIPDLYDPQWTADKVWVTAAMLATVVAWLVRESIQRQD